jgi:hypothetical protein
MSGASDQTPLLTPHAQVDPIAAYQVHSRSKLFSASFRLFVSFAYAILIFHISYDFGAANAPTANSLCAAICSGSAISRVSAG